MSAPGYRLYIDPAHPLLAQTFGSTHPRKDRAGLERSLADLRAHFTYRPIRGRLGLDRLQEARAAGGEPSVINCFDLSALLASHLRGVGFSSDEVFVVLCDPLAVGQKARADFHACVLVLLDEAMVWIDPTHLELVDTSGESLRERYKIHLVFNDHHVYFSAAEKQRLLSRTMPKSGFQCFLYGQTDAAIQAVLENPSFRAGLAQSFGAGRIEGLDPALAERAEACGLLARRDGDGWDAGPRLVLMSAAMERAFHADVARYIDTYLGIVAEAVPVLRQTYGTFRTAERFPWPEVCHSVVAGMLLDLAVGAQMHFAEDVQRTHGQAVVWGFENVSAQNGIGVRWIGAPSGTSGVAQMWHVRVKRQPFRLEPRMAELLARHARGEQVALGGPDALYLRFAKLLRGNEIAIPTFLPEEAERLLAPLMASGQRLVREALLPALQHVKQRPGWAQVDQDESYRHAAVRLLLEYSIDRVLDAGLMPAFPEGEGVPTAWGTWLWMEPPERPMQLIPPGFEAPKEAS